MDPPSFDITIKELRELMKNRGVKGIENLNQLGGINGLCRKLRTSPIVGLATPYEVTIRRKVFGTNVITAKPPKSFFHLVWEALQDVTLVILEIAAVISLALTFYTPDTETDESNQYSWIESVAILVSVGIVVLVTAINDYSKEKQFRGLQKRIALDQTIPVVRSGVLTTLQIGELVVGDLVDIKYGDLVPADGCLIFSNDLKIDESMLTGESDQVKKAIDIDPMILSGTQVMEGSGKIIVTAVGIHSQSGIILSLLGNVERDNPEVKQKKTQEEKDKEKMEKRENSLKNKKGKASLTRISAIDIPDISNSNQQSKKDKKKKEKTNKEAKTKPAPSENNEQKSVLQTKLTKLALQIGYAGSAVAAATVIILSLQFCITTFVIENKPWKNSYFQVFVHNLIIGITILVVAVPEGLPLAVTIALAYSVKRMMRDNNLVRHLDACETMGNATAICSDKTGTLTTNRMTVVQVYINRILRKNLNELQMHVPPVLKVILSESIAVNTSYTSITKEPALSGGQIQQIGNKTECALLGLIEKMGSEYNSIRMRNPESSFIRVYTFNSVRKCMATVIPRRGGGYRVYVKGAAEVILHKCNFMYDKNGDLELVTTDTINVISKAVIETMALSALRTICLAYRDFVPHVNTHINETYTTGSPDWNNEQEILSNLTCLAIVGIEDPVRPEVPNAIRVCQRAGITVRMVTGDNVKTARSIAIKCRIVNPGNPYHLVIDSDDFNKRILDSNGVVQQHLLDRVWPPLRVLARSSPTDKYILVKGIIESKLSCHREIVAVTGDGTNDGPALRKADVGFAMGIAGTDVAKEASDIILTDDNFTSIVKAVMWGRNVYDSIAKFLQFQLTVNCVAIIFTFVGACLVRESPLKAVQMLWVNLIMDTLASLALATEAPTKELLLRKPYGRTKPLLSHNMIKCIALHTIYQLTITFVLLFHGHTIFGEPSGRTEPPQLPVPSRHFTIIFNCFVMMTIFNEINVRKLHGERNVLKGIFGNPMFYTIWLGSFISQYLIVEFGSYAFFTKGLTTKQWLICVLIGFSALIWHQLVVTIPTSWISKILSCCSRKSKDDCTSEVGLKTDDSFSSLNDSKGDNIWIRNLSRIRGFLAFKSLPVKPDNSKNPKDASTTEIPATLEPQQLQKNSKTLDTEEPQPKNVIPESSNRMNQMSRLKIYIDEGTQFEPQLTDVNEKQTRTQAGAKNVPHEVHALANLLKQKHEENKQALRQQAYEEYLQKQKREAQQTAMNSKLGPQVEKPSTSKSARRSYDASPRSSQDQTEKPSTSRRASENNDRNRRRNPELTGQQSRKKTRRQMDETEDSDVEPVEQKKKNRKRNEDEKSKKRAKSERAETSSLSDQPSKRNSFKLVYDEASRSRKDDSKKQSSKGKENREQRRKEDRNQETDENQLENQPSIQDILRNYLGGMCSVQ